jgi:hypothetical protein
VTGLPALIERIVAAMTALGELGETIDDEVVYVRDLDAVWSARLRAVADARAGTPVAPEVERAIDRLVDEAGRISDPHRAIDWLSTLPQAALVAIGEPAW